MGCLLSSCHSPRHSLACSNTEAKGQLSSIYFHLAGLCWLTVRTWPSASEAERSGVVTLTTSDDPQRQGLWLGKENGPGPQSPCPWWPWQVFRCKLEMQLPTHKTAFESSAAKCTYPPRQGSVSKLFPRGQVYQAVWPAGQCGPTAVDNTTVIRCGCVPATKMATGSVWPEGGRLLTLSQGTVLFPRQLPLAHSAYFR